MRETIGIFMLGCVVSAHYRRCKCTLRKSFKRLAEAIMALGNVSEVQSDSRPNQYPV